MTNVGASGPPTLAPGGGVGALQFSVDHYAGGQLPKATPMDLEHMFYAFCERHRLAIDPTAWTGDTTFGTGGSSAGAVRLIGVWYVSDGLNFAFATYTSEKPDDEAAQREVQQAELIAKSIRFAGAP
ncbi:MAG: hypothetical protein ABMA14_25915 [Hyphomonadaceae bacterium]